MNSIQAEQLRQAIASQGGMMQPQAVYFKTAPMAYDSYARQNAKSGIGFFTKVLAIGAAIIFRKNIANVAKTYFPGITADLSLATRKLGEKLGKVKGSGYIKTGWGKYVEYEGKAKNFVNESLATESGKKITTKIKEGWNWLKGLVIKKPEAKITQPNLPGF